MPRHLKPKDPSLISSKFRQKIMRNPDHWALLPLNCTHGQTYLICRVDFRPKGAQSSTDALTLLFLQANHTSHTHTLSLSPVNPLFHNTYSEVNPPIFCFHSHNYTNPKKLSSFIISLIQQVKPYHGISFQFPPPPPSSLSLRPSLHGTKALHQLLR